MIHTSARINNNPRSNVLICRSSGFFKSAFVSATLLVFSRLLKNQKVSIRLPSCLTNSSSQSCCCCHNRASILVLHVRQRCILPKSTSILKMTFPTDANNVPCFHHEFPIRHHICINAEHGVSFLFDHRLVHNYARRGTWVTVTLI